MQPVSAEGGQAGMRHSFHNSRLTDLADREHKPAEFKVTLDLLFSDEKLPSDR